jgi:hypothetical protein
VISSSALPAGAATSAKHDTGNTSLSSIDGKVTACNTGAVVVSSSALPTGAATETTLAAASAKLPATLGQKAMTASMACVLASDQSALPITVASLPLPATAATDRSTAAAPFSIRLSDGSAFYDGTKTGQLPSALVGSRLDVNAGAWLGSTAPTVGSKTSANSIPVVIASDQGAVSVTPPTLTKSTQGATGISTQDLKDAGRVSKSMGCTGATGVVNETIISAIVTSDLVAAVAANTYTVTSGKRFRALGLNAVWRNPTAVAGGVTIRVRAVPSGTANATSPLILSAHASSALATIGAGASTFVPFPEGFEFPAGASICLTQAAITTAAGVECQLVGYEY